MRRIFTIYFIALFALLLTREVSAQTNAPKPAIAPSVSKAMEYASAEEIKAAITYLASDELLGRQPGQPGFELAAKYVTTQLKSFGVKPAGEKGTWFQQVRLRKAYSDNTGKATLTINGKTDTLKYGPEMFLFPSPLVKTPTLNSGLAFAGFGITNTQQNYDDYAGLDVKGKTVIILRGAPKTFPSSDAAHAQDVMALIENAAKHGATGLLIAVYDSTARPILPNPGKRGVYSVMDDKGQPLVSRYYNTKVTAAGMIGYKTLKAVLTSAGKNMADLLNNLKAGKPQSTLVNASISASANFAFQDINSYNIVGLIPGTHTKLKKEYVVHSAHLDHLGVGAPVQGDSIYNGAHDNASGVASLLQIAKIYKHLPKKPKRSILIVMVTGEELGELGSMYFAKHPTVPIQQIVADVNTDMPTIIAPLLSVTALGAEHSSLTANVDEAATYMKMTVEPDPEPEQNRFIRSDQYSFVLQGIPALHIKYGSKTADGKNNLNDFVKEWRAKYYHKPQDDINGIFDFEAGRNYAQLNFLIGYLVANDTQRPVWNKGDIFEKH